MNATESKVITYNDYIFNAMINKDNFPEGQVPFSWYNEMDTKKRHFGAIIRHGEPVDINKD